MARDPLYPEKEVDIADSPAWKTKEEAQAEFAKLKSDIAPLLLKLEAEAKEVWEKVLSFLEKVIGKL